MKKLLFMFLFAFVAVSANALVYSVTVPAGTNACYIAGEMNGWSHQLMMKVDDTHYTIEIEDANATHKYKYSSGPGWGYVEKAADGTEMDNRAYAEKDTVAGWAAVYNPSIKNVDMEYNVTVPEGTQCCYIMGGWDGWTAFTEMTKVDDTHYTITIPSNNLLKYNYFAGNGWGYMELGNNKWVRDDRSYSTNDVVSGWAAVYDKSVPDDDITYSVMVPEGTNSCYIAGGWNRWAFVEMERLDANHFAVTVRSNKALKYLYLSGPDWNCVEADMAQNEPPIRSYAASDIVQKWKLVWEPKK